MGDEPRDAGWTQFDHTADLGLEVTAPSLEALFATAAKALFDLLAEARHGSLPGDRVEREIRAAGADREELLIRWLSELLYLHDTEGILFSEFRFETFEPGRITARAAGELFDPGRHRHRTGIKAVTYHQAAVRREGDRWSARVVFDV